MLSWNYAGSPAGSRQEAQQKNVFSWDLLIWHGRKSTGVINTGDCSAESTVGVPGEMCQ